MSSVKILSPGPLTTIQDRGRPGHQQSGMSVSGVMDRYAHRTANILVGNPQDEAVLEATLMGPTLEFLGDSVVAVTGASAGLRLNGGDVSMWRSIPVVAGDVLEFAPPTAGTRLYIAFAGGINVPVVMDSKSTYIKARVGGLDGRALQAGDVLQLNAAGVDIAGIKPVQAAAKFVPQYGGEITLRVVLGPQDDAFTQEGVKTFLSQPYTVTPECDRMGYRLDGESIAHKDGGDIISDGIVMGAVQVPGNGKPIILMSDRQTTGGYTKIATVISTDIPLVAQARPGNVVRFQEISVQEAQQVLRKQEQAFAAFEASLTPVPAAQPQPAAQPAQPVPAPARPATGPARHFRVQVDGVSYDVQIAEQ